MTRDELVSRVKVVVDGSTEDNRDVALKFYFYPLSAAIFSPDERDGFTGKDGITVKPDRFAWVVNEVAQRLTRVVTSLGVTEVYLSVVVYGMVSHNNPDDFVIHVGPDGHGVYRPKIMVMRDVTSLYS